jgi:hypothetical protein
VWSIAHCVSRDLKMAAGIAPTFKETYGGVDEMKRQLSGAAVPNCAVVNNVQDYGQEAGAMVFALVTKSRFFEKPSYESLIGALRVCRDIMIDEGVVKLMFPAIGCGIDGLVWSAPNKQMDVQRAVCQVFNERQPHVGHWQLRLVGRSVAAGGHCPGAANTASAASAAGVATSGIFLNSGCLPTPSSTETHAKFATELEPFPSSSPLDAMFPAPPEARAPALPPELERRCADLEKQIEEDAKATPFKAGALQHGRVLKVLRQRARVEFDELPEWPVDLGRYTCPELRMLLDACAPGASQPVPVEAKPLLTDALLVGAIEMCATCPRVVSPHFVVVQPEKLRLIADLRHVNTSVIPLGFKLQSVFDIPAYFAGCGWLAKADLRSGYWQVPVGGNSSDLLGLRMPDGGFARWRVLPFGLSCAPRIFQALTGSFVQAWRAAGLKVAVYLDDFIWGAATQEELVRTSEIIVSDLLAAGLRLSPKKTFLRPHDVMTYLGVVVDADRRCFALPARKVERITAFARDAIETLNVGVRTADLRSWLGRVCFATTVCPMAAVLSSAIHADCAAAVNADAARTNLSADAAAEMMFWCNDAARLLRRARPFAALAGHRLWSKRVTPMSVDGVALQDASETGVGITCHDLRSGKSFDAAEPFPPFLREWVLTGDPRGSSTAREIYGVARGIVRLNPAQGSAVRGVCDNQAAVVIAAGCVTTRHCSWAARYLVSVCERLGVFYFPEWAPREQLDHQDAGSRMSAADLSRASVPLSWLTRVCRKEWGTEAPDVDMFADIGNRRAEVFCARWPQPGDASAGDGLSVSWNGAARRWAFPPFSLARPTVTRALTASAEPDSTILLVPDDYRDALSGWRTIEPPLVLTIPPDYERVIRLRRSLLCVIGPPRQAIPAHRGFTSEAVAASGAH